MHCVVHIILSSISRLFQKEASHFSSSRRDKFDIATKNLPRTKSIMTVIIGNVIRPKKLNFILKSHLFFHDILAGNLMINGILNIVFQPFQGMLRTFDKKVSLVRLYDAVYNPKNAMHSFLALPELQLRPSHCLTPPSLSWHLRFPPSIEFSLLLCNVQQKVSCPIWHICFSVVYVFPNASVLLAEKTVFPILHFTKNSKSMRTKFPHKQFTVISNNFFTKSSAPFCAAKRHETHQLPKKKKIKLT